MAMKGDHAFKREPKGSTNGGYVRPRVQIGFDPAMLRIVTELAKQNDRSFAAEVRFLLDCGLAHYPGQPRHT